MNALSFMKGHKNFIFSRLAVLVFVLMATLAIFFIGYQLETTPSENSQMDRWVGIATVCTAIASIVIGLITIWVMFDQQKMQNELIRYQKMEHQPNFSIKIPQHYGHDENAEDSSYEEVMINNIGNHSYLIKDIQVDVYITCSFKFNNDSLSERILLYDYFTHKVRYNDDNHILTATSSREKRNLARYNSMLELSRNTNNVSNVTFAKDILIMIEYVDLYEETHVKYFMNGYPIDKETYIKHSTHSTENEFSIDNFDVIKYIKIIDNYMS